MKTLFEIEKEVILERLNSFGGNKTKAAQSLGITLKTIYNKLHQYEKENKPVEVAEVVKVEEVKETAKDSKEMKPDFSWE